MVLQNHEALMENTLEDNFQLWNHHYRWQQDGDEWDGQATACGQPYLAWKQSVIEQLIQPNLSATTTVVEIGPGHGRWSQAIAPACGTLRLVDFSPNCIAYCQQRLAAYPNVHYQVNDGRQLIGVADDSVDFVWSYDCFVHLEAAILQSYLGEIKRVLRPNGKAILHHAGRHHWWRKLNGLERLGKWGQRVYHGLSLGCWSEHDGYRSQLSKEAVARLARSTQLQVEAQIQWWDKAKKFGIPRYNDWITILRKAG